MNSFFFFGTFIVYKQLVYDLQERVIIYKCLDK
jgi:hypothetical protein